MTPSSSFKCGGCGHDLRGDPEQPPLHCDVPDCLCALCIGASASEITYLSCIRHEPFSPIGSLYRSIFDRLTSRGFTTIQGAAYALTAKGRIALEFDDMRARGIDARDAINVARLHEHVEQHGNKDGTSRS